MGLLKALKGFLTHRFDTKHMNILVLGLNGAGKTKMLNNLQLGAITRTTPFDNDYLDFIVETVSFQSITFRSWDINNSASQPLWNHFYKGVHIIVFVVDASDETRIQEAKNGLASILKELELRKLPLLILVNKKDLNGVSTDRIIDEFDLERLRRRTWLVKGVCAKQGDVLHKGVKKLLTEMEALRQ